MRVEVAYIDIADDDVIADAKYIVTEPGWFTVVAADGVANLHIPAHRIQYVSTEVDE